MEHKYNPERTPSNGVFNEPAPVIEDLPYDTGNKLSEHNKEVGDNARKQLEG